MKKIIITILFLFVTIHLAMAQTSEVYIVSSKTLNIRTGPGKNFSIIGILSEGDSVNVINKSETEWWEINLNNEKGFVYSSMLYIDPYSDWEKTNYVSGVTPECENYTPKYDFDIDNFLSIKVGSGTDVVIKLMQKGYNEDACIRIVYIKSGDTYEIKNIPQEEYYLKIAYGKDIRKKIIDDTCYVKFMNNANYEKGTKILNFKLIKQPDKTIGNDVYENWSVPSYELFLDIIESKNSKEKAFVSKNISEAEFNK